MKIFTFNKYQYTPELKYISEWRRKVLWYYCHTKHIRSADGNRMGAILIFGFAMNVGILFFLFLLKQHYSINFPSWAYPLEAGIIAGAVYGIISPLMYRWIYPRVRFRLQQILRNRHGRPLVCFECGYLLRGVRANSCPECGFAVEVVDMDNQ